MITLNGQPLYSTTFKLYNHTTTKHLAKPHKSGIVTTTRNNII